MTEMAKRTGMFVLAISLSLSSFSQFADSLKAQLLKDWGRSKKYTQEYLSAMPDSKYSFAAQDSIRNFAQQMLHLAQGTVSLMEAATGKKIPPAINRPSLEKTPAAWTKDSVSFFVNLSYDYALEALKEFDMSKSPEYVTRGKFVETRLAWMLKAYEHQAHHRGQTTIYIRLVGIKPPNEKLFGE
jgi:uncharacterized damage-inducible protein DinB